MLRKEGLKQAASYFRFDADTVKMISQSTNVVYQCNRQHKPMILRISESGRCAASIEAELEWIHYLSCNGVHVSTPIRGVDGQYILRVDAEHEMCLVTAFEMANGQCCDPCNAALWGRDIFIKWGEVMGRMHALAKSYVPQLAVRKEWEQTHIDNSWLRQGDYLFILNKLEQYERSFLCFHKDSDAYGLIHYDLHPYNFLIYDGHLNLFDFDDCRYGWYAMDIAIAAVHAGWIGAPDHRHEKNEFTKTFIDAFLTGYFNENHLSNNWLRLIPTFMDYRNTASYFWWLKDWDGNEESLTDFQRHAVSYAGHLIRSGQCFDGCDIEI